MASELIVDISGMTSIFSQIETLSAAMQLSEQQHRVVSQNLANANTVEYKAQQIDFESLLKEIANNPETANQVGLTQATVEEIEGLPERVDGNNVDVAAQISALKGNALLYESFSNILASKIAMMKKAITG